MKDKQKKHRNFLFKVKPEIAKEFAKKTVEMMKKKKSNS